MKQEIDAKLPAIQTEYARSIVQQLLNLDVEARPSMKQLKQVLDENYYIELGIEEHEDSFGEVDVCEEKSITMMRADDISLSKAAKVAPRDTKVNMQRSLFESEKFDISGEEPPAKPQKSPPRQPINEPLGNTSVLGIPFGDTGGEDEEEEEEEEEEDNRFIHSAYILLGWHCVEFKSINWACKLL